MPRRKMQAMSKCLGEKMDFEEAERLSEQARENEGVFEEIAFQQGKGSILPKDLPFVSDCYRLGSDETRQAIENMNSCLSMEDAEKLSRFCYELRLDDFMALLKQEVPQLYKLCKNGHITTAALYNFIDFRAGKKVIINIRLTGHTRSEVNDKKTEAKL